LVSDNSRGGAGVASLLDQFKQLPFPLQRTIQQSLQLMERLAAVQKIQAVDDSIGGCDFDITNCAVVTSWAAGCTWNEALAISGVSPGDLARILSRALDGLRQLGNLPYSPVRRVEGIPLGSTGIHPEVRRLCRDAAKCVNRYPVKDPLALEDPSVDVILVGIDDDEDSKEEADSDSEINSQS
jgi:superfamily II RNA helicase